MTNNNRDPREFPVQITGMRYYNACVSKERMYNRLLRTASSYVKEVYNGELEDVLLSINFTKPNTVMIIYMDKEENSHRIEIPIWGE